jgi:putative ABC transport system permease protein
MGSFLRDLRFGARALARAPGFTVVALLTLAIGIGANTTIFSVVNAVLLKPLPFPEPERLVAVYQTQPSQNVFNNGASYPNYAEWQSRARSFEALGAIRMHDFTLTGRGEPALVAAGTVTANVFDVFHPHPLLGRALGAPDDVPGAPPVAVLGEALWRERFGADPAVVGKTVALDERLFTIVGVLPDAFRTPPSNPPAQLWTPLAQDPVFGDLRQRRAGHYLTIVGRLKHGAALGPAQAELAAIAADLARQYPKENEGWGIRLVPLAESLVAGVRTALTVLLGAVGLLFLIACVNVANLLLARSGARSREVAIRTALGAGRARLVRQLLTECLLLGVAGGTLGLLAAYSGMRLLRAWLPSDLPRAAEIAIDGRVLAFSFLASLAAAAVFGLAPALQATGANLTGMLREGSLGAGESGGKRRLRDLLVLAETAVSFILLVGAGLLAKSFLRLRDVDLGFRPEHVLTAGYSLPRTQFSKPEQWTDFSTRLIERLNRLPGVDAAAAALPLPLYGGGLHFEFQIEGRAAEKAAGSDLAANYTAATPRYFAALGIPMLRGRAFSDSDAAGSPSVCIVSSAFARRYFPGEDPIGRRLLFGFTESVPREIVGVAGDVKRDGLGEASRPEMYVPFVQDPWWASYVAIRAAGDPGRLAGALREEVRALDPALPLEGVQPMTQIVADSVAQPRFRTTLLALFSVTALLLAAIGIYGVLSYSVGRRTREVGVRLALGATRGDVIRLVFRQGLGLTALGLAAGLAGALLLTRYLSSLLFEVSRWDVATYAAVAFLLLTAAVLACWIPARRAMRVDPVVALRFE